MKNGSVASKDVIGWVVNFVISLIPLLIFYLNYRIYKKQSNKKIENLKKMLYKEIIARKDLEIKRLEQENKELKKKLEEKEKELGGN